MIVAFVHVHVKPEHIDDFIEITRYNHDNSLKEPGCARFDVLRHTEDHEESNVFYLYEVYESLEAAAAHKETDHYQKWRDTVEPYMEEPRFANKAVSIFPEPWA